MKVLSKSTKKNIDLDENMMIFVQIYIKTYDLDEKQIICPHCPCNFMACILCDCRDTTALQPGKNQLNKPSIIDTNSFALGIMGKTKAHTSTILSCSTLW